jgi:hypothetical protein
MVASSIGKRYKTNESKEKPTIREYVNKYWDQCVQYMKQGNTRDICLFVFASIFFLYAIASGASDNGNNNTTIITTGTTGITTTNTRHDIHFHARDNIHERDNRVASDGDAAFSNRDASLHGGENVFYSKRSSLNEKPNIAKAINTNDKFKKVPLDTANTLTRNKYNIHSSNNNKQMVTDGNSITGRQDTVLDTKGGIINKKGQEWRHTSDEPEEEEIRVVHEYPKTQEQAFLNVPFANERISDVSDAKQCVVETCKQNCLPPPIQEQIYIFMQDVGNVSSRVSGKGYMSYASIRIPNTLLMSCDIMEKIIYLLRAKLSVHEFNQVRQSYIQYCESNVRGTPIHLLSLITVNTDYPPVLPEEEFNSSDVSIASVKNIPLRQL